MANEGTLTVTFASTKSGATVSTGALSSAWDVTGYNASNGETQNLGTSDEALTWAEGLDSSTLGNLVVYHSGLTDLGVATTATVLLSYDTGGSFATYQFAQLKPGQAIPLRPLFPTGKTVIYAKSSSGNVKVRKYASQQ